MKMNLELLDKNRQLNNAYSTISQQEKLASLGELSAGVAHEINNPLAFVSSNLKSLAKYTQRIFQYEFVLDKDQEEEFNFMKEDLVSLFEETKEGVTRIENITKSLKRFSRMDEESRTTLYDINQAIKDTILISKNQCPSHTEIKMELSDIPLIECYANDINQVLLNMVINALQAQSESDEGFRGYLKIGTVINKNNLEITIEDNGPGIPEMIEKKIYDPFFTTKEIGKGTGLGLGICFNIINNKHNGALWLDNRAHPTRFIISIPLKLRSPEHE
jgi:signal transduction histidine kinase